MKASRTLLERLTRTPEGSKRRWRRAISHHTGYVAARCLVAFVSRLPLGVARGLAAGLGSIAYWTARHSRRTAIANLTHAFGAERSPAEIRRLARRVFRHQAIVFAEWLVLRRWPAARLRAAFPEAVAAAERFAAEVRAAGGGVSGVTAHFGNWEVLSLLVGHVAPGLLSPVARKPRFEKYQGLLHELRSTPGLELIYTDTSVRPFIRALRAGRLLGFLPDHDVRTNGALFVEYFGRPAFTATLPVQLARKLGLKMTFVLLAREGRDFRLIHRGLFDVPRTGDEEADLHAGTQHWTRLLEEEVRARPEQWLWTHDRWQTTPESPRTHLGRGPRRRPVAGEAAIRGDGAPSA